MRPGPQRRSRAFFIRPLLSAPKVTSRKDAVRLLAEYRVADAMVLLGQAWGEPRQHGDVRRAIVSASRFLLDHEGLRDLLSTASADPGTATAVLEVRLSGLPVAHRPRFAALVGVVAASPDPDTARAGLESMPRWAQWAGTLPFLGRPAAARGRLRCGSGCPRSTPGRRP